MDQLFEFTVEDVEELKAIDLLFHNIDGSMEIHRLYTADDKQKLIVIDGGGTEQ